MQRFRFPRQIFPALLAAILTMPALAQMDNDAIMMNRKQLCTGITYQHSGWDSYWEGTFKRKNANIGKYSSQMLAYMGVYGITNNLSVSVSVPYVWNKVTAGTLHDQHGFQDIAGSVKWRALRIPIGKGRLSIFFIAAGSTPLTNYTIDFMPLSLGMGSTTGTGRVTADFQKGIFFTTLSSGYTWRGNVKLDRTAYYTTTQHNSNQVDMPNVIMSNLNLGVRRKFWQAELIAGDMVTQGGFDIRKNDMPFVSNTMNALSIGVHGKYTLQFYPPVEIIGGADFVVAGRNAGQSTTIMGGIFYRFTFHSKKTDKN